MDDIIEFLFDVFLEPICNLIFSSKKVRTGVKTTVFFIFTQAVTITIVCGAVFNQNIMERGRYVMLGFAVLWCIATVLTGIYGHRHKWKHW